MVTRRGAPCRDRGGDRLWKVGPVGKVAIANLVAIGFCELVLLALRNDPQLHRPGFNHWLSEVTISLGSLLLFPVVWFIPPFFDGFNFGWLIPILCVPVNAYLWGLVWTRGGRIQT